MAKKKKETRTRASTLGASYRAASTGVILAAPAIAKVHSGVTDPKEIANFYKAEARNLAIGTGVHIVDQVVGQKMLGHNSALGRGSVTAWAAEAIATVPAAIKGAHGELGWGTAEYTANKTGYYPNVGFQGLHHDGFKAYLVTKGVGGVIRKVSQMGFIQPVARPVKKMLGSAGGAL